MELKASSSIRFVSDCGGILKIIIWLKITFAIFAKQSVILLLSRNTWLNFTFQSLLHHSWISLTSRILLIDTNLFRIVSISKASSQLISTSYIVFLSQKFHPFNSAFGFNLKNLIHSCYESFITIAKCILFFHKWNYPNNKSNLP